MMSEVSVLIVSTKVDLATDVVVERLRDKNISCYRINTEDYPFQDTLTYYPDSKSGKGISILHNQKHLNNPTSIWYRRVRTPSTPDGMDEGIASFCRQEAKAVLVGSILGRPTRWMSHPTAIWEAEYKPYQLQLAASIGLTIPPTVITNDPKVIRAALYEFGEMVVKPTRSGYVIKNGSDYAIYTSRLLAEHLDELETAKWSPSIYQALIPKQYDVRVTFVGDSCFAVAIDSSSDPAASIDWRQTNNPDLPHYPISLPSGLELLLRRLMKELRLAFGAIDLIQTPNGDYVFLEINPNGQWLWIDEMLDLGISNAVANWLSNVSLT